MDDDDKPTIDTSTPDGEILWGNNTFTGILNCDFTKLNSLTYPHTTPLNNGSQASSNFPVWEKKRFNSIGTFFTGDGDGHVFKFEPLNADWWGKHRYGPRNKWGIRDRAWYNKKVDQTTTLESGTLGSGHPLKYLVQKGVAINSSDTEWSNHCASEDGNYNYCTSWLDTFYTKAVNETPPNTPPNVTFRKNTYFEICVSFHEMKTLGFRHSFWLMPATNDAYSNKPVKRHDNQPYQNSAAYDGSASNGLEIDIYEHEHSPNLETDLLMKGILNGSTSTTNNLGSIADAFDNGIRSKATGNTQIECDELYKGGFHRIGFYWGETELIWFFNGRPVVKDISLVPTTCRMYLILSREFSTQIVGSQHAGSLVTKTNRDKFNGDKVKIQYIKAWSVNTGGESLSSVLRVPEQLRGWNENNGTRLRWGKALGSNKYNLYRNGNYLTTVVQPNPTSDPLPEYFDSGVPSGRWHEYYVVAVKDTGGGASFSSSSHKNWVYKYRIL